MAETLISLLAAVAALAALVIALAGAFIAWGGWRRTREERPGHGHEVIASGDGRARFLCMAGMLTSALICMAILYTGIAHFLLPVCGT